MGQWKIPAMKKRSFNAEHENTGPGANSIQRVKWAKQLTNDEAKDYTIDNVFTVENSSVKADATWFQQIRTKAFVWPVKQN